MKIKKNIGETDKKIRIILGIAMILVAIFLESIIKWFLLVGGLILIITALIGFCGLYTLLGIDTCKIDKKGI